MSHNSETEHGNAHGVATYVVEAAVAFVGLVFGIIVIVGSMELGTGWTTDGPGAGDFPYYMGIIISGCCAWIIGKALFGKNKNTEIFVENEAFKRVLAVLIPIVLFVFGIELVGLYVAGTIYITLFMVILGKFSWVKSALLGICVSVFFFLMFEVWFLVPLYNGMFDPRWFLGY